MADQQPDAAGGQAKAGAPKGKHSEERTAHFSGTRVSRFDTRMGTLYLFVPKLRTGGYIPFFVIERQRAEAALIQVVHEAYINGVSTRRIEKLAKRLGVEGLSAGQVSDINKGLDEQVASFRTKPLREEYPVIWVDAVYQKIRKDSKVVNLAILIVMGVNLEGIREILAVEPMWEESEATYSHVFKSLQARGLKRAWLVISDAHAGLQSAVKKCFLGASWQRCKVHFMRNILGHVAHRDKAAAGECLRQIWLQEDRDMALELAARFRERYGKKYPKAVECLEDGLEDSLQYLALPEFDKRKTSSTNILERLNKEVRRRARVVGVFPSEESFLRLIVCYLLEYSEDWPAMKAYISPETIQEVRQRLGLAA